MGVSILSGPARCSPSGPTSALFRFRSFRNDSGVASLSPAANVWRLEANKRMMKSATSVGNNIANGRTIFPPTVERGRTELGFPDDGGDSNRLSYPQFPNFAGGHRLNPQAVLMDTVPKDSKPTGVQRPNFEHKRGNVLDERGTNSREQGKATSTMSKILSPKEKLLQIFDKVLVVDSVSKAREVVGLITTKYRDLIFACDTEVAKIDVKQETPVGHGEVTCFSIYCGLQADFGSGKTCIWVDVLDGGVNVLMEFAPFFEDSSIKKVCHNYSFDSHVIENYGIKLSGFHADTMHLARLWDSSRPAVGGYSLEALTNDPNVIHTNKTSLVDDFNIGKISMKGIFGKKKLKKDGSEGKLITIAPVEVLQREERIPWICYSALDSIVTLRLFQSMKMKLQKMEWFLHGHCKGDMYDFYEIYWRPFGCLLVKMESEGMLVDRVYLSKLEEVAKAEQKKAVGRFRNWASIYCPDAKYMNVGSDTQIRQLFFGGISNSKYPNETLPETKTIKVPNTANVIEAEKKTPSKYRNITLCRLGKIMKPRIYTAGGWPSVSGAALKAFAGKVSLDHVYLMDEEYGSPSDCTAETSLSPTPQDDMDTVKTDKISDDVDISAYGTAYEAFGRGNEGMEACHAIATLREICSIDSLISNFILPLQGSHISGSNGCIHCSLNINTETGRLSARRPNLQNQPALEKDRYKIRQAFIAAPGNSLIVADYGQANLLISVQREHAAMKK